MELSFHLLCKWIFNDIYLGNSKKKVYYIPRNQFLLALVIVNVYVCSCVYAYAYVCLCFKTEHISKKNVSSHLLKSPLST